MNEKPLIIIIALFTLFLIAIPVVFSAEESCSSVSSIISNKILCDRKEVEVTGEVINLRFADSANGNKYTTFNFNEGNKTLSIFSYTYLPIAEGDIVKVKGIYFVEYLYEGYIFPNQINVLPSEVVVLKDARKLIFWYIGSGLIVLSIVIILLLVKKNREKYKKKMDYMKGHEFENYALSLFKRDEWEIENISGDMSEEIGRRVNSDSDPDIIVKNKHHNIKFAIECKYRYKFFTDKNGNKKLSWAKDYQIERYHKFQEENGFLVYILIGIGGFYSKPEQTFLLPLKALQYPWVKEDYLKKFERKVTEPFWLDGSLLR